MRKRHTMLTNDLNQRLILQIDSQELLEEV